MWSQLQKWLVAGIASLGLSSTSVAFGQASEQSVPSNASPSQPTSQPIPRVSQPTASYPRGGAAFPQGKQPLGGMVTSPSPQLGSLATPYGVISQGAPGFIPGPSGQFGAPGAGIYGLVPGQPGQALTGAAPGALAPGELGPGAGLGGTAMGGAGAPGGPAAGAPMAGAGAAAGAAGLPEGGLAGLGGEVGAGGAAFASPFMIGDQGPFSFHQALRFPPIPGPFPPGKPVPGTSPYSKLNHSVNAIVPAVRGFKIADNQSPRPMDRVFVDFNYYDNVNSALNHRLGAPISNMQAYHEVFGAEKTFLDGNASLGLRLPVNSLAVDSSYPGLGGTHSAFGNLAVFGKYVLYQDNRGNLLSAGLSIDTPTGPASFGGYPVRFAQNAVGIQPFLGYILKGDQWFLQGFGSIDVPTVSSMPTMMYLDAGIGYFLYRTQEQRFLTAIIPTYELHMNIPLNHYGYSNTDFYGVPPVLDMTFGVNFGLCNSSYLTAGYVTPVTGPRPFSGEFVLQFNFLFGRSRRAGLGQLTPPVTGG
ncbi:MAG: hypothetical protein ABSH35_00265 [Isosphaeraceae bacterium]